MHDPLSGSVSSLPATSHRCTLSERATNCLRRVKPPAFVHAVRSLFSKAAAILIDKAVKTNRDGRCLVGGRIKPIGRTPVGNTSVEVAVLKSIREVLTLLFPSTFLQLLSQIALKYALGLSRFSNKIVGILIYPLHFIYYV